MSRGSALSCRPGGGPTQHESGIRMVPSVTVTTGVLNDEDRLVNAFGQRVALALRPMTDTLDLPILCGVEMSPIAALVEIKRSPQDVFLYVADPTQRPNWQDALEHIEVVRTSPTSTTRCRF